MQINPRMLTIICVVSSIITAAFIAYMFTWAARLPDISSYRSWHKVNPQPVVMEEQIATMCIRMPEYEEANPHMKTYITVYVNEIGKEAMFSEDPMQFPEGSIIVKEKYGQLTDEKPELLTVMEKRFKGYNPAVGDWDFYTAIPDRDPERGNDDHCISCHRGQPDNDFTFRSYLPQD